jgi:hypothetical protein
MNSLIDEGGGGGGGEVWYRRFSINQSFELVRQSMYVRMDESEFVTVHIKDYLLLCVMGQRVMI